MNKYHLPFAMLITLAATMNNASALQVIGDHTTMNVKAPSQIMIVSSHADIDIDGGGNSEDLDVDVLGVDYSIRFKHNIDIIAQAGLAYDAEFVDCDGSGFYLGAGARGFLTQFHKVDIFGYALLNYTSFDVDCNGGDIESDLLSLHVGPTFAYTFNQHVTVTGGVDLIIFSDGESKISNSANVDIEHDDNLNLHVGAKGALNQFQWHAKLGFIGEQGITIGVSKEF